MDQLTSVKAKLQEVIWRIGEVKALYQQAHEEMRKVIEEQIDYKKRAVEAEALIKDLKLIIHQLRTKPSLGGQ